MKFFKNILLSIIILIIAGCGGHQRMNDQANTLFLETQKQIIDLQNEQQEFIQEAVEISEEQQLITEIIEERAFWLDEHISLRGDELPFSFFVARILSQAPVFVEYQADMDRNRKISMNFSGTVEQALFQLASEANYSYITENNTLRWQEFETQVFDVSFMPGTVNYFLGNRQDQDLSTGTGAVESVAGHLGDATQFSNLQGAFSVWQDLENTINQLLSKNENGDPVGKASISQSTTTVTINDRPSNIVAISRYLEQMNRNLSRQVAINIQVLEVNLSSNYNLGIDWKLVYDLLGSKVSLEGGLARPITLSPSGQSPTGGIKFSGADKFAGTEILINALSQQGQISVVTEPQVVTMNNQVAEINITNQQAYLSEVQVSTTGGGDNATTRVSLKPGVVTSGFSLYILPTIQGDNVYLHISSSISDLVNISRESSGQKDNEVSIQVPALAEKRFNQRSMVRSNSTLILAGFKQMRGQTAGSSMFDNPLIAGRGALNQAKESIVLITPTIIG